MRACSEASLNPLGQQPTALRGPRKSKPFCEMRLCATNVTWRGPAKLSVSCIAVPTSY